MHKIMMDCDPGIDDTCALACALTDPDIDLQLITTVAGNVDVEKTSHNALNIVEFFGRHVPVAKGAKKPLMQPLEDASRVHGEKGIKGYDFGAPQTKVLAIDAVTALKEQLLHSEAKLTIIATGAFTNLGVLLTLYPEVKEKIQEIIIMGGSLGRGNMTSTAEFNVFTDPHAAKILFESGLKLTMIGLDSTLTGRITQKTQSLLQQTNAAGKMLSALINNDFDRNEQGTAIHDLQTIFYLLHPEAFKTEAFWVDVVCEGPAKGATVADIRHAYHNKTNATVCLGVDQEAFNDWLLNEVKNNM
ncbi:non-specific riboncleoside hydrolase [Ligilactobacillus sp. WC1T17]|uniref:Non-specific riboncleoside hydrolase n=2 Tax=Ligilactobacillus TaxID=2767887 RepID=A0ABY1AC59_9LACO|nr:non-specific riboncleoside hydrolase [Ligilactobacillus ruminis]